MSIARHPLAFICLVMAALPASGINFSDSGGWKAPTSLDTLAAQRGDPVKLAWSLPPDGTKIGYPSWYDCRTSLNSEFAQRFGPNYREMFTNVFSRIGAVSGLEFFPCAGDDGALADEFTPGVAGVRGDIRVVASDLTAIFGGEAWANMPHPGGSCIIHMNIGKTWWTWTDALKIVMHETGHTIGFGHQEIYSDLAGATLFLTADGGYGSITGFLNQNGPQFDDLYAMHRMYGDVLERNGGNDTPATASNLGNLTTQGARSLGTQINGLEVGPAETDFLSIDGASDTDCFKLHLDSPARLTVTVTPKGPTYSYKPEGGELKIMEAAKQSALHFDLLTGASQVLAQVSPAGLGQTVSLVRVVEAGDYCLRIAGTEDTNQFYRLDVSAVTVVLPPRPVAQISLDGQQANISFGTAAGYQYRVLTASVLNPAAWTQVDPGWVDGTGQTLTVPALRHGDAGQWFYRVEVLVP